MAAFTIGPPPGASGFRIGPPPKGTQPAPGAATPKPLAQTATGSGTVEALDPGFRSRHPIIGPLVEGGLDALQGGGRELIGQGIRLASAFSPKGGAALQRLAGDYATPIPGKMETAGRIGTQIGEFAAPGGAEKMAADLAEEALPMATAVLRGAAKLLPYAATGAGITALQGGNPYVGAGAGALGAAGAAGLRRVGEGLAESAAGVTSKMRKLRQPLGRILLDETEGSRPGTVTRSADKAIGRVDAARAAMANNAGAGGLTVLRKPAEDAAGSYADTLETRFHEDPGAARAIHGQVQRFNGNMSPAEAVDLSRAMGRHVDFGKMPGVGHPDSSLAALAARHANEMELEKLLGPQFGELGNKEAALIALKNAMQRRSLGPGVEQRLMDRGAARTGALASAILGAQAAGPAGAVAAPILQEFSSLPGVRMAAARAADSVAAPVFRIASPAVASAATQTPKDKPVQLKGIGRLR